MSDPFRLRVLKAVSAKLKTITVAGGYQHDLADFTDSAGRTGQERVFRGRPDFGFSDPRPMISILEHPGAIDQLLGTAASTSAKGDWALLIQGFVEDDPIHPTDPAHLLAADVVKCLATEKRVNHENLFGFAYRKPCVLDIKIGSPIVRPWDEGISEVAYFFLAVTLTLSEDQENPFAQS